MKAIGGRSATEPAGEQAWELVNDFAIYEACKSFLEPVSSAPRADTRFPHDGPTYRALVITVEEDGAVCCTDRVGALAPCGCDQDVEIEAEHDRRGRIVHRMLHPVSRMFRRVRQAAAPSPAPRDMR